MKTRLIIGGPGSGKTTRLLDLVQTELGKVKPDRIAFVSFTRKAADEARDRAISKFGFTPKQLPYVRTLHSLCYLKTSVRRGELMTIKDYKQIALALGVEISWGKVNPDDSVTLKEGDLMIHFDNLARTTKVPLKQIWEEHGGMRFPLGNLEQWVATCNEYKVRHKKIDFTDLLQKYVAEGFPIEVQVAFVDEAQDLTPLEWDVVSLAFRNVKRLYVAGDDDQAIYGWSGADVDRFLKFKHDKREILPVSYRLPTKIFDFARRFAERFIGNRYDKDWKAHPSNPEGFIKQLTSLNELDLTSGSWYLLARNSCFLKDYEEYARQMGVSYTYRGKPSVDPDDIRAIALYKRWRTGDLLGMTDIKKVFSRMGLRYQVPNGKFPISKFSSNPPPWHEVFKEIDHGTRLYYKSVEETEGSLTRTPRVCINTIHAVKGGEADRVVVKTDLTRRTFDGMQFNGLDAEGRVFYVAATRALKGLYIMVPTTPLSFDGYWEVR